VIGEVLGAVDQVQEGFEVEDVAVVQEEATEGDSHLAVEVVVVGSRYMIVLVWPSKKKSMSFRLPFREITYQHSTDKMTKVQNQTHLLSRKRKRSVNQNQVMNLMISQLLLSNLTLL
jgi:hypothetical protein